MGWTISFRRTRRARESGRMVRSQRLLVTQHAFQHGDKFGGWARLGQVGCATRLFRATTALRLVPGSEDHNRDGLRPVVSLQLPADFPSIDVWQHQIEQNNRWPCLAGSSVATGPCRSGHAIQSCVRTDIGPKISLITQILNHEHPCCVWGCHRASSVLRVTEFRDRADQRFGVERFR